jgi:anti-sigma B factor antagonist
MLSLNIHKLDGTIIFQCIGRIVLGEGHVLRRTVCRYPKIATAVLDMAAVTAIDAEGLGILVTLRNWTQANGTELKLLNLTPRVENLLNITHLRSIFKVCSVPDIADLLCRAIHQSSLGTEYASASQGTG